VRVVVVERERRRTREEEEQEEPRKRVLRMLHKCPTMYLRRYHKSFVVYTHVLLLKPSTFFFRFKKITWLNSYDPKSTTNETSSTLYHHQKINENE